MPTYLGSTPTTTTSARACCATARSPSRSARSESPARSTPPDSKGGHRLLPAGRGHHTRRRRSGGAQLLRAAGRGDGRAPAVPGHAGLSEARRSGAGRKAPALLLHVRQGGDGLAPPGACLQRLRRLPLRGRRGDGGGRRRQLRSDVTETNRLAKDVNPLARESESYYRFQGSEIETLKKVWMEPSRGLLSDEFYNMPGLGALYSRASTYVFGDWNKCGELMGLAPYGRPGSMKPLMEIKDGELDVPELAGRVQAALSAGEPDRNGKQPVHAALGGSGLAGPGRHRDACCSTRARWLRETTGAKNLCIAGGVALNCVANGRIAREAGFDNVWIQPAAGDDGIAIGCAYYGHLAMQKKPRSFVMDHAYLGVDYTDEDVASRHGPTAGASRDDQDAERGHLRRHSEGAGRGQRHRLVSGPLRIRAARARQPQHPGRSAHGRDEGHPEQAREAQAAVSPVRADRSRRAGERDLRGRRGTPRTCCLPSACVRSGETRSRRSFTSTARRACRRCGRSTNERLYRLLKEFEALTGVPVLLNTSFNIKGEPIVETPQDAIECFLTTGIDYLAMHDMLIAKTPGTGSWRRWSRSTATSA